MLNSLPNLLTILRIVCIPVLMALFYVQAPWAPWAACGVFVAAAITDYFDGWLARRLQQVSAFGRLLDPIADKMLVAATLLLVIGFGRLGTISLIPAVVILLREFLISGLREFLAGREVGGGLAVSGLAKWKTTVQMVALALLIVGDAAPAGLPVLEIGVAGLWIAAVLTVVTGWDYVVKGVRHIAETERASSGKAAGSVG